ncbi:MAG TPA: Gfo/Idh/MocA family oxidoreductase [Chthoniobacterales bacterium]|nr:Gfo/Idh/MocA family oxidoreductase [Chthoniobacterales bacterium]
MRFHKIPAATRILSMTQKTNHKLRVGIVGAGEIVRRRHLPALQRHPDVEIVAVSNSTYESSEEFCRKNVPHATPMTNWAELLAIPELDIIWIGTPPYMHSAVTMSALEAGKHVFCQARMAMDLAEAEEMLAASRRYPELVTMLCPPPHGMRGGLLVQKLLAEQILGKPHHLRLQSLNSAFLDPDAPAHWRQRIEISGLNILTLGIYAEVLQSWFGEITGLYARGKIAQPVRQGYDVLIPDLLTVLCTFGNGMEGVLEFSGIDAHAPSDRLEVYGDLGTLTYDFGADLVHASKIGDRALHVVELAPELETDWHVEDDFIAAVKGRGRIRPHPDFDDGVRYMRVVQAVADSRRTNDWVDISAAQVVPATALHLA